MLTLTLTATLPLPNRYFPLTAQRLKESLDDERILVRMGFYIARSFTEAVPHSFRVNEGKTPPIFHRRIGVGIDLREGKYGGTGFMEGPGIRFPGDLAKAKVRSLIQTALTTDLLSIKSAEPKGNFDTRFILIGVSYYRPKTTGYINEIEEVRIWVSPEDARIRQFINLFNKEVLDFAQLALKKYPPKKVYPIPDRPDVYSLITELTEEQVKEIEKELSSQPLPNKTGN